MSDPTRNPSRAPTTNTNTDMTEFARQKQGRANAFFFNGLELADPANKQKNTPKSVNSSAFRLSLLNGRLTQLNLTLQQQLATTIPEQYKVNSLPSLYPTPSPIVFTTGNATVNGSVIIFLSSGTFKIAEGLSPTAQVDVLVVGGGGGGGGDASTQGIGGGGGGGGTVFASNITLNTGQAYTVTVGTGGSREQNGGNSVFLSYTAVGGGGGGGYNFASPQAVDGKNGGSGGGAGLRRQAGAGSQGGNGALSFEPSGTAQGGGGGGAGGTPGVAHSGGDGQIGKSYTITGILTFYGGGGGGGSDTNTRAGGQGGGGNGAQGGGAPTAGADGFGGGGGGTCRGAFQGASGGSGTVIFRIL